MNDDHFAILQIYYTHRANSILIRTVTNNPCYMTCFYTDKEPLRHKTTRTLRGLTVPWGAYFCFVAWHTVVQQEPFDSLIHTFQIPDWAYCQTKWFTFTATISGALSPSIGPIFEHHHPGVTAQELTIPITHDNDDYRRLNSVYQACPSVCPPILEAGYFYAHSLHVGCGLRFINVSIPRYATILETNLIFTCWQTLPDQCRYTRISAEQEDNPPDFSLDDWLSARARWQNSGFTLDWDYIPVWTVNNEYQSLDIAPIIQELVNRPSWNPGNAMVLFWNDWDERAGHLPYDTRRAYSHNVDPAKAVRLYCKYTS